MPMATKLGRTMTSLDGLLPIMSHDSLITWPFEIRGSLTGGSSARKRLSLHRLVVNMIIVKRKIADPILTLFMFEIAGV